MTEQLPEDIETIQLSATELYEIAYCLRNEEDSIRKTITHYKEIDPEDIRLTRLTDKANRYGHLADIMLEATKDNPDSFFALAPNPWPEYILARFSALVEVLRLTTREQEVLVREINARAERGKGGFMPTDVDYAFDSICAKDPKIGHR